VKKRQITAIGAALFTVGLAACGSSTTGSTASKAVTLNVWLMSGSAPTSLVSSWNQQFESAHPGVTVKVSLQQWTGIVQKTDTTLATSQAPDVLEMGNTYVASFAGTGGLANLTSVSWPNQSTWLSGLKGAGYYNGHLYGVPYYAGDRIVIANQYYFTKAGITSAPTSMTDLLADCAKIKPLMPSGSSCIYIPGEYWYAMFAFLFGESGNGTNAIATQSGSTWTAQFSSSADQTALSWIYTNLFQTGYDQASATENDTTTATNTVMQNGDAAMIVEPGWDYGSITASSAVVPWSFALPGYTSSSPMPTFLGGSNLGVAEKSQNKTLAEEYIQLVTGTQYQSEMATVGGVIPNTTSLLNLQVANPPLNTAALAAKTSWFTPQSPNEATVESDNNYEDLLGAVLSGQMTASAAAAQYDPKISSALTGS
jgi:N,N'-diacetylchitobiose transport system substrate-binding protein